MGARFLGRVGIQARLTRILHATRAAWAGRDCAVWSVCGGSAQEVDSLTLLEEE